MNSSDREKIKLLLDSTYLLPIIGVEVEGVEKALKTLKRLREEGKAEYYYTPFNILEILGKLSKVKYSRERVSMGLHAITEEFKFVYQTAEGCLKALNLRSLGHRDLIDLLLYATALERGIKLLTRDRSLVGFLEEKGEATESILREDELLELYG
ncbi:MAG: PIN domain-containing protein [Candidatus Bathyarchaeia archaeon]